MSCTIADHILIGANSVATNVSDTISRQLENFYSMSEILILEPRHQQSIPRMVKKKPSRYPRKTMPLTLSERHSSRSSLYCWVGYIRLTTVINLLVVELLPIKITPLLTIQCLLGGIDPARQKLLGSHLNLLR